MNFKQTIVTTITEPRKGKSKLQKLTEHIEFLESQHEQRPEFVTKERVDAAKKNLQSWLMVIEKRSTPKPKTLWRLNKRSR